MSIFGKIKDNLHHGGVTVRLQVPSSIPGNQVIPVTVAITTDSPQTIDSVKAKIIAQTQVQGISIGNGANTGIGVGAGQTNDQAQARNQTVAQVESREQFTINPGETKTISLQLFINGDTGNGSQSAMGAAVGNVLQAMSGNFEHVNYTYSVFVSADVHGISLDPSDEQPIQLLPPTEGPQVAQPIQPLDGAQNYSQQQNIQPIPPNPVASAPIQPIAQTSTPDSNQDQ
jgi:hypothetical protein